MKLGTKSIKLTPKITNPLKSDYNSVPKLKPILLSYTNVFGFQTGLAINILIRAENTDKNNILEGHDTSL